VWGQGFRDFSGAKRGSAVQGLHEEKELALAEGGIHSENLQS